MSKTDKAQATDKAENYSVEQVNAIRELEPVNLEKAKALESVIGKSYRSIIAKCLSEGIEYQSKPAPAKREAVETKAEIVAEIGERLGLNLRGLEKATVRALVTLRDSVVTGN